MKKIVLLISIFILARPAIPFLEYIVNYDYIVKELCENKEKPALKCNGKCHLMKELAKTAEDDKQEEFKRNKKELLKYVLPLMHGIYALHNRKCNKSTSSVTGDVGLLGLSKVNIEEKLNFIVESDYLFQDNGATFKSSSHSNGHISREICVWLHGKGKHQATPHLGFSMTGLVSSVYGESVEKELLKVAKVCAIFTEEWK